MMLFNEWANQSTARLHLEFNFSKADFDDRSGKFLITGCLLIGFNAHDLHFSEAKHE
jgi:hypothetical protein